MTLTQKRAKACFKTRLLFHLAERKRRSGAEGFTLVELMIVVAVIGILVGVALPQYLGARAAADAGAKIGSLIGQSRECATFVASGGIGVGPTIGAVACTNGSNSFSATFASNAIGVRCVDKTLVAANTIATVTVSTGGVVSCVVG